MNKALLYSKFVKYDMLDHFIISNPSASILLQKPVDIYIDIQSIYRHVLSSGLTNTDIRVIAVNILNLAGHYRHYFTKHRVNSRIYIVNGNNVTHDNITLVDPSGIFNIVQKVVQYFPLTYYIEKEHNSCAIIMSLLQTETTPLSYNALVISNDIYSYQIPAHMNSAFLLRPSTNPKFVTTNTVIDTMYSRKGNVITSDLSSALLPVIMAYHKCPELGMNMINNFRTTIDIIRNKINNNQIINSYNSPIMFKNEPKEIIDRLYLSDLIIISRVYDKSYESLVNNWRIYKPYNMAVLANALDNLFNRDTENIFNYMFLLEVNEDFFNHVGP